MKYEFSNFTNEQLLEFLENVLANNYSQKIKASEKEILKRMSTYKFK